MTPAPDTPSRRWAIDDSMLDLARRAVEDMAANDNTRPRDRRAAARLLKKLDALEAKRRERKR